MNCIKRGYQKIFRLFCLILVDKVIIIGLFHKYLKDASEAVGKKEWGKAVEILKEHQINHVNNTKQAYGIIQRMIDSLHAYQTNINEAVKLAEEKQLGAGQRIDIAEFALL